MEFLPIEIDNEKVYAGFWRRLASMLIDIIILIPLMAISHLTQSISMLSALITLIIASLLSSVYMIYFQVVFQKVC